MKTYKITLTPLESYFFGGDLTFGKAGSRENGSYIAKSTLFPQQSAFLGVLRKEIIEYLKEYKKAKKIVGASKFFIKSKDEEKFDFGSIKSVSPLFVQKKQQLYIPLQDIFFYKIKKEDNNFLVENFNPKEGVSLKLFALKDFQAEKIDNFFIQKQMVGNVKNRNKDAFFKKIAYQVQADSSFVYFIEIDNDFELEKLDKKIVYFGADRSKFLLCVSKEKFDLNSFFKILQDRLNSVTDKDYIFLLSDSYININIKKHCAFAITQEIPFRNITKMKNLKSKQFYFYEKGSLFINPDERLKEKLNKPYLQQIGYNKFITKDNR